MIETEDSLRVAFFHSARRRDTRHDVGRRMPRNMYWGAHDLTEDGRSLVDVFPEARKRSLMLLDWLFDRTARRKRSDVDAAVDVRVVVSKPELWKLLLDAMMRRHTSPLVWIFSGYPLPWSKRGLRRVLDELTMRLAMKYCAAICPHTSRETEALRTAHGHRSRIHFVPYGIDADFYAPTGTSTQWDVIVVGDNRNRDWETVLATARRHTDLRFLLVSRSYVFESRFALPNVEVRTAETLASTRELLHCSDIVWVPTKPNSHFSGITTVLMGMAAGKVVILDDADHLADYALRPDENCIVVERGDPDAAGTAVRRLQARPADMAQVRRSALRTARHNSTMRAARALRGVLSRRADGETR